jgi:hypothetical protein
MTAWGRSKNIRGTENTEANQLQLRNTSPAMALTYTVALAEE